MILVVVSFILEIAAGARGETALNRAARCTRDAPEQVVGPRKPANAPVDSNATSGPLASRSTPQAPFILTAIVFSDQRLSPHHGAIQKCQAAMGLPACLANDSVQLAIALVVAFLVTGAALRARFRHDDAYDGPPGVQASPYVGVA